MMVENGDIRPNEINKGGVPGRTDAFVDGEGETGASVAARDAQTHILKTWLPYWLAVRSGRKTFEVRRDDRGFIEGDLVTLRAVSEQPPHDPVLMANGDFKDISRWVTYVLRGGQFGVEPGYVVLGLSRR